MRGILQLLIHLPDEFFDIVRRLRRVIYLDDVLNGVRDDVAIRALKIEGDGEGLAVRAGAIRLRVIDRLRVRAGDMVNLNLPLQAQVIVRFETTLTMFCGAPSPEASPTSTFSSLEAGGELLAAAEPLAGAAAGAVWLGWRWRC